MQEKINSILKNNIEEIISEGFARYSKYIIQDRALPDVRDGLKPVQRRILYAMFLERLLHDKKYKKSATPVGRVISNFHPHGESSIYESMVRMSQDFKLNIPLVDMHGNNGSIDGDPPAAQRYTESRLSKFGEYLLNEIDKNTVNFIPNFDDTTTEPTVLPSILPNLLINGSSGISSGYATVIAPHNANEVADAILHLIDNPNATLNEIIKYIKAPDFPTGGEIVNPKDMKSVYETGRGKIILRSKAFIEGSSIIITEIPYETVKSKLVKKISEIADNEISLKIKDVIDETSDQHGLKIVIELASDADPQFVLNYLYQSSPLQTNFNLNMVCIANRKPEQLPLIDILKYYLEHQKQVYYNAINYTLEQINKKLNVVEGLIKAISIIDEIIEIIRSSKNKSESKNNLIERFLFNEKQAEAIVNLRLYRLSNTDIFELEKDHEKLNSDKRKYTQIISSDKNLSNYIREKITEYKELFGFKRRTKIINNIEQTEIKKSDLILEENVMLSISKQGYVKITNLKNYSLAKSDIDLRDNDYTLLITEASTKDHLLAITSKGNFITIPISKLPKTKWSDMGINISTISTTDFDENIIFSIVLDTDIDNINLISVSSNGFINKNALSNFISTRFSKPINYFKISDSDYVTSAFTTYGDDSSVAIIANNGLSLKYNISEIPLNNIKTKGVIAMKLKENKIVSSLEISSITREVVIVTNDDAIKRLEISQIIDGKRTQVGKSIIPKLKTKELSIVTAIDALESDVVVISENDKQVVNFKDIPKRSIDEKGKKLKIEKIFDAYTQEV